MHTTPIPDPGLGNTSYLVDLGDGSALVVDPERDPRPYLDVAARLDLTIRHVAETHLHADFVSGARELVALGARLIASKDSALEHPHLAIGDGDEIRVGDLTLRAIETPGHTPEHMAYVIADGSEPKAVFTGGTPMVGGVARPDLISEEMTPRLARQAYRSVRRLLDLLPAKTALWPTHGGGSFCSSAGAGSAPGSTVQAERRSHPAVTLTDEESFAEQLLSGLGTFPGYFLRLREVNRDGPHVFGSDLPALPQLHPDELNGQTVVDVRPIDRYASGHIPGSISIELRDQFGTWLGWLIDAESPIVLVVDDDQDEREVVRQALNIGHENLAGRLDFDEWRAKTGDVSKLELISAEDIGGKAPILDVRQQDEWDSGHVPGATHIELGALPSSVQTAPQDAVVHCGHGQRAMTAASILERSGRQPAGVTADGYRAITDTRAAQ